MAHKKDMVNHPPHYNSHPSGVECIEIIRSMNFNIGNAFKYLYRRENKDNLAQDIKKSIWYINDEIAKRNKWGYTPFAPFFIPIFYTSRQDLFGEYNHRKDLIDKFAIYENDLVIIRIFNLLHEADIQFWDIKKLEEAKLLINNHL